jgi:hypothetical protein
MPTSFEKSIHAAVRGSNTLGESLPTLISLLIKLGLLALFFAYLIGFATELWTIGTWAAWAMMIFVILIGLLCLGSMIWAFNSVAGKDWNMEPQPQLAPGSVWPFVFLALVPFVIIIVVHYGFGYSFTSLLLKLTQERVVALLQRINS